MTCSRSQDQYAAGAEPSRAACLSKKEPNAQCVRSTGAQGTYSRWITGILSGTDEKFSGSDNSIVRHPQKAQGPSLIRSPLVSPCHQTRCPFSVTHPPTQLTCFLKRLPPKHLQIHLHFLSLPGCKHHLSPQIL